MSEHSLPSRYRGQTDPGICWVCGHEFSSYEIDYFDPQHPKKPYCRRCDVFTCD